MATPITVILITGRAHAGKSTAADMLRDHFRAGGRRVAVVALADQLKVISQRLVTMFTGAPIPLAEYHDVDLKDQVRADMPSFDGRPFSLRSVLQTVGTEIFRDHLWPDIWCDFIARQYIAPRAHDVIIIADCRFPNELAYFARQPGCICISLRICRDTRAEIATANHRSETAIDALPVDHEVANNGTLDALRAALVGLMAPPSLP